MSALARFFRKKKKADSPTITAPQEIVHVVHVDKALNWKFDDTINPKTQFTKMKVIGSGGFGTVWQICHRMSMKILAGKLINPTLVSDDSKAEIEHEIQLMREVSAPNTVTYYGCVPYDNTLLLLMEYCDRGSLRDLLDKREKVLSEDQIAIVMHDMLMGLNAIHNEHRIIHRDIKAANMLLTSSGVVKIGDFGVSRQFESGAVETMTIVGTPYWMSPEVIQGISYGFSADIWSVGITAVELAEGAPPYVEYPPSKAMVEIAQRGFPGYRHPEMHSNEFCDFVSHCVVMNPAQRWTINQLLKHPFMKRAERLDRQKVMEELLTFEKPETPAKEPPPKAPTVYADQTFVAANTFVCVANTIESKKEQQSPPPMQQGTSVESLGTTGSSSMFELGTSASGETSQESFDTFGAVGTGDELPPVNPGFDTVKAVAELPDREEQLEVQQKDDQVFQVSISSLKTKRGDTRRKTTTDLDDDTFSEAAKLMSQRIPFVPMKLATKPEEPVNTLYVDLKSALAQRGQRKLPPLYDKNGIVNMQTAIRHPDAVQICASVLLLGSVILFGKEGLLMLLAVAFLTHLIVTLVDKRKQMEKRRKERTHRYQRRLLKLMSSESPESPSPPPPQL